MRYRRHRFFSDRSVIRMSDSKSSGPRPAPAVQGLIGYTLPKTKAPVDLRLDMMEGLAPPQWVWDSVVHFGPELLRRYPNQRSLEEFLAGRFELEPDQVLVTAGADSALDAACRAVLCPDREAILPTPTFEMIERYVRFTGARVIDVPWENSPYPIDTVIQARTERTAAVFVVSPNNPTGATASIEDLARLSEAFPHSLIILDLAYVEFADADPTRFALLLPNILVIRTLSKAWGLAGMRIGYALGPTDVIGWMRAASNPYPVSGVGLELAETWMDTGQNRMRAFVEAVRVQRIELSRILAARGIDVSPSQAHFIFFRGTRAEWFADALAGFGIAARTFPGRPRLGNAVRITLPGNETPYLRLRHALKTILEPQAILFDIDGVLADVSQSCREAIIQTAAAFGAAIKQIDILTLIASGEASNDWIITQRLLAERDIHIGLDEVTARFEALYQGGGGSPGLKERERLLVPPATLERLASKLPMAVVTGRPRADTERFLCHAGIARHFKTLVCMEDAPLKPRPDPFKLAMERLGIERAWMVGNKPDDMRGCRAAEVLPLAILSPGEAAEVLGKALYRAGAARLIGSVSDIENLLHGTSEQRSVRFP